MHLVCNICDDTRLIAAHVIHSIEPPHHTLSPTSTSYTLYLQDLPIHSFFPSICQSITRQKGFLCHWSTTFEFTTSCYPKFVFFTNIPFQAQNTPLQNCIPSLGSFPSPWTVYPDFDSCYSHFMPYRMTSSVRHRAIEVHYYYYYYRASSSS